MSVDSSSQAIASGAVDNNINIWLYHPSQPDQPWSIAATLQASVLDCRIAVHTLHIETCSVLHASSTQWVQCSALLAHHAQPHDTCICLTVPQLLGRLENTSEQKGCESESAIPITSTPYLCVQAHTGSITALAQASLGSTQLLFSIAEDQQLCIWECSTAVEQGHSSQLYCQWKLRQQLTVSSGLQHCLAVSHLPDQPDW